MSQPALSLRRERAEVRHLRQSVAADLQAVASLRAVQRRSEWLDELLGDLDRQIERGATAAIVTLMGATGAGKSTLLNAVAGRELAREGVDRPTTSQATIHAPADADVSALALPGATVERYQPAAGQEAYVLVDAPDMNSIADEHAEVARALLQRSDVLLVVLHRQSIVEAAPVEMLDEFARRRALAFVLNRADELTDAARDALLTQISSLARERWNAPAAPLIAVSARHARLEPNGPDRRRLQELLAGLVGAGSVAGIRRHNALGTATLLADVFVEVEKETRADHDTVAAELGDALAELASRVAQESSERWQLRRIELERRLRLEVARRWDGPVGWSLRLGGRDLVGAGAAGWIARRHPLLAAGTAVGAAAVAAAHDASAESAWRDSQGLLPAPKEFAHLYRQAVAPLRIRLGRLFVSDDAMPLPPVEVVFASLAEAVDTGWRRLLERDLPQAAERTWLRSVGVLFDLPVYALVAWVVYQAAVGFLEARYVGVDMLTNATMLGGVYVLLVRAVLSRAFAWRARRLLRQAVTTAHTEVDDWRQEMEGAVGAKLEAQSLALARLADLPNRWQAALATPARSADAPGRGPSA